MNRLKELRESQNLLTKDVADYLKINEEEYLQFETSKEKMPADFLINLAKFYNTSTDYLLELTDERNPYPKSLVAEEKSN